MKGIMRYGLVFKLGEQCYLAEYNPDGTVEDAAPIDDDDGVYADLNPREMSLVEIVRVGEVDEGEQVGLQDLKTITIQNDENPDDTIMEILENGDFPMVAENIFESEELEL
jgi:hypothetical protein